MADLTIVEGEAAEVSFDVENTGDVLDTQDIVLTADNTEEDRQTDLELASGDIGYGKLYFVTETGDAATYTVAVETDDAEDTIEVEVTT